MCSIIVQDHPTTQTRWSIGHCSGPQPGHKATSSAPGTDKAQTDSDNENDITMERLIPGMLHNSVSTEDAKKRKRSSAKAVGGGSGCCWVLWVAYVTEGTLALSACGIVLHQAIAPPRYAGVCHFVYCRH